MINPYCYNRCDQGYEGIHCSKKRTIASRLHSTFSDPIMMRRDWSTRFGSRVKGGDILNCGNLFAGEYLHFDKVQ